MIVDCFTFFNEFDLLELRLTTLDAVVDRFVLCEAPFTFRGEPKPLSFAENAERFARWRDRITVLTYPGPPHENPWQNEWGQRDFLSMGLRDCAPDDLVLIGDCDELPDPRFAARRPAENGILVHQMLLMRGYANRADAGGAPSWPGTRALRAAALAGYGTLSAVRRRPLESIESIASGWHFSSLGGAAAMQQKMRAYSHVEYDIPYFRDRRRLEVHYDVSGGSGDAREVPAAALPQPLRDDPRWTRFLWRADAAIDEVRGAQLEHAHGCFAYLPAAARDVAVLAPDAGAWREAASAREVPGFAGVFDTLPALRARLAQPGWVIVDGLERFAQDLLAELHACDARVVAFARNARSREALEGALAGRPLPPGRAAGRAEAERAIAAAGYGITRADRIANRTVPWVWLSPETPSVHQLTLTVFTFAELGAGALHDFQSDAFVFCLAPAADTIRA
jgi:beta-1,4-mannosyl-glycoprotein beta-1,4-N-acetylglucosaminyltransferase